MTLETKWNLRAMVLDSLSQFVSITNALFVIMAIRIWKLCRYGLAAIPGHQWEASVPINYFMKIFFDEQLWPLLIWLPLAIIADSFIRKVVTK